MIFCVWLLYVEIRDVSLVFVEADLETDLRTKTDRLAESGDLKQEKSCCHI